MNLSADASVQDADTSTIRSQWLEQGWLAALANARNWLQAASEAMFKHRNLIDDALPEGLSPINEARRSVQLAHTVRTMRDARRKAEESLVSLDAPELPAPHALSRDAIKLACREIDTYLARLPLPPI